MRTLVLKPASTTTAALVALAFAAPSQARRPVEPTPRPHMVCIHGHIGRPSGCVVQPWLP